MNVRMAIILWAVGGSFGADFHVAPDGRAGAMGSASSPWDIVSALKHPAALLPGDTIWIHGGVYRAPAGSYVTGGYRSNLKGAPGKPIRVRVVPGERAIIDGRDSAHITALTINGSWTWYEGLEVLNSDPNRRNPRTVSNGPGTRGPGVEIYGPNVKLINSVIHDTGTAIGFWQGAIDSEVYGTIVFNNGWMGPERGHGHGIYIQNLDGVKSVRDSVFFNQFGGGVQVYGSGNAYLRNILIKGNTVFNDGVAVSGGKDGVWNLLFSENALYSSTCSFMDHVAVGKNLRIEKNYFGPVTIGLAKVDRAEVVGNTFFRRPGSNLNIIMTLAAGAKLSDHFFDENSYHLTPNRPLVMQAADDSIKSVKTLTLAQMKQEGFEKNGSTFVASAPQGVKVFVRSNEYDPSRANVTVYNWDKQKTVNVDVSALGIRKGDRYELRNIQNYYVEKLTGIYNGAGIQVPMTGWSVARPIGMENPVVPTTFPEFGVFQLTWKKAAQQPAVTSAASRWLPVATGSLAECQGEDLALTATPADGAPAAKLGATELKIVDSEGKEHAAALFSASPEKITFQVPENMATGYARVSILRDAKPVSETALLASTVAPGIFSANGEGTGPALCSVTITTPDATAETVPCSRCDSGVCEAIPIVFGGNEVTLSLYGTGIRNADPASVSVRIGDQILTPDAMAPVLETPGLDLVNVRLPSSLSGRGESEVLLTAGGTEANPVTIHLQ